jgi:hypothetical protein
MINSLLQCRSQEIDEIIVYDKISDSAALWLASFRPRMKNDFWTDKNSGLSPAEETKHSLAIPHGVVCGAKLNQTKIK